MGEDQVGRLLSADYIILVNGAALAFNVYLIWTRRWAELALFNVAALVNVSIEIAMSLTGIRHFQPDTIGGRIGSVLCLGWSDNGLFACIAYMNVRWFLKRDYKKSLMVAVNLLYFVGLPLLSIDYGLFPWAPVLTWRAMPGNARLVSLVILVVLMVTIYGLGYGRVLAWILLVGVIMELGFETRLFLVGVRPLTQGSHTLAAIVHNTSEFKFPMAMGIGFIVIKAIYKLPDLKDSARRS